MDIVCVLGSPRHDGNSTTIANRFIETAGGLGAHIRAFELNRLSYRGCQGCCACKTKLDSCALKDDLTEVLEAIKEADALVLSSPVYFSDIPGQVKSFIDRTYSYLKPNYITDPTPSRVPRGKKALLILTQGAPEDMMSDVRGRYEFHMRFAMAMEQIHVIRATGVGPGGIPKHVPENYLLQAEEVAKTIMRVPDE
jgi:multimeric flavodoxin WrbA